jgi:hypothetical protein
MVTCSRPGRRFLPPRSRGVLQDARMATSTWRRVNGATARVSREAVQRMEQLPWFAALPPQARADVGLVVQAGLETFSDWLRNAGASTALEAGVFAVAPRELARSVSLKQTVQLIRVVVGVFEEQVPKLAEPGREAELTEQVLRYSREIAFAAAEVYAAAAEARGAWDARVEAGVVEALVRGQVGELTLSRATSLGWTRGTWVTALAARAADHPAGELLRAHARHLDLCVLTGEAGGGLLVVLGGSGDVAAAVKHIAVELPPGPVVCGPVVSDLELAAGCVSEALVGLVAAAAWPQAPRPVDAGALLAERVVLGDDAARRRVLEEVHSPLEAAGGDLLSTAAAFLEGGSSVEGTGRALYVHPNTVRYRIRRMTEVTGYDLLRPRDAQVVRIALILGRTRPQNQL